MHGAAGVSCTTARACPGCKPREIPLINAVERAALDVLVTELGWPRALRVAASVRWQTFRCQPFGHLPPPTDKRERGSRAQAGDAIRLLRALRTVLGEEEARRITRRVIRTSALTFLDRAIGELGPDSLDGLSPSQRDEQVRAHLDRFPNVTASLTEASEERVRFDVTRCRLVELTHAAGEPSLAHVFCSSDAAFFASKGLRLDRPSTLADGADACRFDIRGRGA